MKADQAYTPEIVYYFKYDITAKIMEQDEALIEAYGLERFYYHMPYGFSDSNVVEEDREVYNEMFDKLDAGANYVTADFRMTSDRHWTRVAIYRERPDSNVFQGVVQDVSKRYEWIIQEAKLRKKAQKHSINKEMEALQLMRAINETYDMVVSVNLTQDRYTYLNHERYINREEQDDGVFSEIIAYHAGLVIDDYREMYLASFSREALLQAYQDGKKGVYLEYQQADDEGELHWLATHTMFVENPYTTDITEITISRNIDERVRKEKENQLIIKDALKVAERANDAKSDFLSRMSHDIRTPMNAIIGMTTIGKANSGDKEKVEDCLNKIEISSKFLLNLINEILDLSKIESGKMRVNFRLFSMKELLQSLFNSVMVLTNDKNQIFRYRIDEELSEFYRGDALRIEQILMNLLSNACKFTPENGEINFSMQIGQHDKERDVVQIAVEDNGIGIAEEFIANLFEPFEQNSKRGFGKGSGLGLAIVQNLVHLMNGTISVESKLGEGSKFLVELPLYLPENETLVANEQTGTEQEHQMEQADKTTPEEEASFDEMVFHGERILVVEDNEINQEVAKTIFEMHNLSVDIAADGYEAIDKFLHTQPGDYLTIFMDIQMPGIDGYETTKRIRNSDHADAKTIPIYAMTANAFDTDVSAAKQHGMNGHIAKPVDFKVAARVLAQNIKNKKDVNVFVL